MRNATCRRLFVLAVLTAAVLTTQGCASVGKYFLYRYNDLTEIADAGLTITTTPQIGLYWNSLELITVGYCDLDGYFVGFGGGQIGVTRVYANCWAFLYGEETIGWGPMLDTEYREDALIKRRSGVIGILTGLAGVDPTGNGYGIGPNYTPACVHFVPHIAYVGLVWNLRYTEIVDFVTGWVGLDISGDDGYQVGKWSFPRRSRPPEAEVPRRRMAAQ